MDMAFKFSLNRFLGFDKGVSPTAVNITAQNARKLPNDKTIVAKIINEFQDRNRADIQKWRQALELAKQPNDPRAYALQDLYENLESDGHFISERELRKSATLNTEFSIINLQTGKLDTDKTELFKEEWFYNFREDLLEHIFKGFTVMELTDPAKLTFDVISRRNVQPKYKRVFLEATGSNFIQYNDPTFLYRIVEIGKEASLGLMGDLCGQLIWKRNAQQSWAEFSEKYGMPLLTATTNKTSESDLNQIKALLDALGEAARAVLPEGTTIDIKPFTGSDSFQVYDKQIERINSEISKPIVGGTMITDNGSSRSQSEVHERNLDDKIAARDRMITEFITNGQVIPILNHWGYNINPQTDRFRYDPSFELSLKDYWDVVSDALEHYDIPDEWVSKTFNFPIEKRKDKNNLTTPVSATTKQKFTAQAFTSNFR